MKVFQLSPYGKRFKRFRQETEIHKKLSGRKGILPLVDFYLDESGRLDSWIATELATPINVALMNQTVEAVVSAIFDIATTLSELASEGTHHRDIKVENLFFLRGDWVIGDFGLADYPEKENLTSHRERIGSNHYTPREMIENTDKADPEKADVFALAKTLWVLLTGQNFPLDGPQPLDRSGSLIQNYSDNQFAYVLDSLIDRSTRDDPNSRPTMRTFANELGQWLSLSDSAKEFEFNRYEELNQYLYSIRDAINKKRNKNADRDARNRQIKKALHDILGREMAALTERIKDYRGGQSGYGPTGPSHQIFELFASDFGEAQIRGCWTVHLGIDAPEGKFGRLICGIYFEVNDNLMERFVAAHVLERFAYADENRFKIIWSVESEKIAVHSTDEITQICSLAQGLNENFEFALKEFADFCRAELEEESSA